MLHIVFYIELFFVNLDSNQSTFCWQTSSSYAYIIDTYISIVQYRYVPMHWLLQKLLVWADWW